MDRLVTISVQELHLPFKPNHPSTSTFKLTNLMHTMSVAISLTTTSSSSLFSFPNPYSILPPLSSSTFALHFNPSPHPPLSSPPDSLLLRTSMLPTGKANQDHLRRLFSKPGPNIFKDAIVPIWFVGDGVVEFLLCPPSPPPPQLQTREIVVSCISKAVSGCTQVQINRLLWSAVVNGCDGFVSGLIEAGGDVKQRDFDGGSLLSGAVTSGNLEVVRILVELGCRIDDEIDLVMHDATEMNRVDMLEILGRAGDLGKLVNSVDSDGRTPIHVAAVNGHVEALRFCISMNGDVDCVDYSGWTPLHCAAAEGHVEVVELLLECCLYSKYAVNKDGKTPFSVAVDNGVEDPHLLDILHLDDVLHRAARLDDVNAIKSCIAQGAKVNGRDQNGWTPLHRAAFKGRMESVKALLNHGAQVDLVDNMGYTPLHCAIEAGQTQVALYLIAHGARGSLKSIQGVSPLNSDRFKNHPAFVSPLCGKMEKA